MRKRTVFACFKIGVSAALAGLLLFLPVVVQAQAGFKGIPVLLYHYVGAEAPDYPYLNVDTPEFSRQIKELRERGYRSISLADLTAYMRGEPVTLPEKPVLITFDDGYEDNYTQAFPVLKQEGFRAAIFMVQRNFNRKNRLSVQQIQEMEKAGIEIGSHTRSHPPLPIQSGYWMCTRRPTSATESQRIGADGARRPGNRPRRQPPGAPYARRAARSGTQRRL